MIKALKPLTLISGILLLSGCYAQTQYSGGADYLAAGSPPIPSSSGGYGTKPLDARVAQAANVEPNLRLPGRFGIARLVHGQLTAIPDAEAALWMEVAGRHPDFGTFAPITPLIAHLAANHVGLSNSRLRTDRKGRAIEAVRIGAARQHIDTVLIYEAGVSSSKDNTLLAIADLTIIGGAFLPTRHIETAGKASAILVDVRNGYAYGSAATATDLSSYFTSWGSDRKLQDMQDEAILSVVSKLAVEIEGMMVDLQQKVVATQ